MIDFPNAKINLGLNIVSKRPDGYHNVETVFYPINLCDALEIVPAKKGKTTFTQTGMVIEGNSDNNLVVKALNLLKTQYKIPEIDIFLRKNIPFGAGLGGGSSDAAFMLKLLNEFANLHLSTQELEEFVGQLGADCAFFIQNKPVFAEGIGNVFTPIEFSLKGYYLLLIKPDIHVSTQEAYANIRPHQPEKSIQSIIKEPISSWKNQLINDFETNVFAKHPQIEEIKQELYNKGAIYASMSGSGSSVYSIFDEESIKSLIIPSEINMPFWVKRM
jgi:4-diphosphocytidyl-2-C-methyl-D-erythritol kinase